MFAFFAAAKGAFSSLSAPSSRSIWSASRTRIALNFCRASP